MSTKSFVTKTNKCARIACNVRVTPSTTKHRFCTPSCRAKAHVDNKIITALDAERYFLLEIIGRAKQNTLSGSWAATLEKIIESRIGTGSELYD